MSLYFEVQNGPFKGLLPNRVKVRAAAIARALKIGKREVSLVMTNDAQIHELNRVYRKKNKPTDVLAFATQEGDFAHLTPLALGDVVVSVETAARQAAEHKRPLLDEITMLCAHGLLHLLGWDHDTDAEDAAMTAETARLCALAALAEHAAKAKAKPSKAPALGPVRAAGTTLGRKRAPRAANAPGSRKTALSAVKSNASKKTTASVKKRVVKKA